MEDDFEKLVEILQKSSERTRNFLYIFMLINLTALVSIFGADVWNRPSLRVKEFTGALICARDKMKDEERPNGPTSLTCGTLKSNMKDRGYDLSKLEEKPTTATDPFASILINTLQQRAGALVTAEVDSNSVAIPLIGVKFDIDYLWIVTSYIGVLSLVVINASLRKEIEGTSRATLMLITLSMQNKPVGFRCYRLVSNQLLLAQNVTNSGVNVGLTFSRIMIYTQKWLLLLVVAAPALTQFISIFYNLFIVDLTTPIENSESHAGSSVFYDLIIACLNIPVEKPDTYAARWDELVKDAKDQIATYPLEQVVDFIVEPVALVAVVLLIFYFYRQLRRLRQYFDQIEQIGNSDDAPAA